MADIFESCVSGDVISIKNYLRNGGDVNAVDHRGLSLLMKLIVHNNIECVKFLLSKNVDVVMKDNDGNDALHHACKYGFVDIVQLLLSLNVNINSTNCDGWNSLFWTCSAGYIEIVKLLVLNKCNLMLQDSYYWNPFICACSNNHIDIVKFLISNGYEDIYIKDKYKKTGLDYLFNNNRNEIENYYKTYQNWLRRKVFIQILVENKFISNNSNYLSNPTSIYDKVFSTNELLRTILSYL